VRFMSFSRLELAEPMSESGGDNLPEWPIKSQRDRYRRNAK